MECSCKDWKENIKIINSSLVISSGHGFAGLKKAFIYCPYCSCNLEEEIAALTENIPGGRK